MRRLWYILQKQKALTTPYLGGIGDQSLLSNLPVELILDILDYLRHNELKTMSLVSHSWNRIANLRLWTFVDIRLRSVPHERKKVEAKEVIHALNAVARDPERAQCVQELTIRLLDGTSSMWILPELTIRMKLALIRTTNLRALEVKMDSSAVVASCAKMLCDSANSFKFTLEIFKCGASFEGHIDQFLSTQNSIESYFVYKDSSPIFAYWNPPPEVLPSIRDYRGHCYGARSSFRGRSLNSVEIISPFRDRHFGVVGIQAQPLQSFPKSRPYASMLQLLEHLSGADRFGTQETIVKPTSGTDLPTASKTDILTFELWSADHWDPYIPQLIRFWIGVSLDGVRDLRVHSLRPPHPNSQLLPLLLEAMPNVVHLTWNAVQWTDQPGDLFHQIENCLDNFVADIHDRTTPLRTVLFTAETRRSVQFDREDSRGKWIRTFRYRGSVLQHRTRAS